MRFGCRLAAFALGFFFASAVGGAPPAEILTDVSEVAAPGIPGTVSIYGPDSFCLVAGRRGSNRAAVAAGSRLGAGRVVAFGHTGYFAKRQLTVSDTAKLMGNSVAWAGGSRSARVLCLDAADLADVLGTQGFAVRTAALEDGLPDLDDTDVLCLNAHGIRDERFENLLLGYVRDGGGLVTCLTGWGWLQLNPGQTLAEDCGANRVLAPAGLAFTAAMARKTSAKGFSVEGSESPLLHADLALTALQKGIEGESRKQDLSQATVSVCDAARAVPVTDPLFRPRVTALLEAGDAPIVPTRQNPVTEKDGLERVILTLQTEREKRKAPAAVEAHPAAADFPGLVPADAPRVSQKLTVDTRISRWHSTGLYAAPGEIVTLEVPESIVDKGLKLRIGAHKDGIWKRPSWWRFPEITRQFPIRSQVVEGACAFGGPVYIDIPKNLDVGIVSVTVRNAVRAPYYVLGRTSLAKWRDEIRHAPAPWAELASDRVIITVPSENVRDLQDPASLMSFWNEVLDACADLACTDRRRTSPERYVTDRQISIGYMHSGYPIMTFLDAAPRFVDLDRLRNQGDWGMFHEMGHNHQSRDWTFHGTTEVTVNLFTVYILDTVCGGSAGAKHVRAEKMTTLTRKHIDSGADFDAWKRQPFTALAMYLQIKDTFGWDPFKRVFAEYRALPDEERPKNDDEKRDQWLVRLSRTVEHNLGPFFETWGVPTSAQARASIADLPTWFPPDFPPGAEAAN